jgi:hypothetical protein
MAVVIVLILLGLTAWLPGLPLKGRLLHFLCFFGMRISRASENRSNKVAAGASGLFYFILDVEEYVSVLITPIALAQILYLRDSRRIWFWRHAPLIITIFACCVSARLIDSLSFIQSLFPHCLVLRRDFE